MTAVRVLFRVDASTETGTGHLMRSLALAQALVDAQATVFFAISEAAIPLCKQREDWVGTIISVPVFEHDAEEAHWLANQAADMAINFCLVDGYGFDEHYRQRVAAGPWKTGCFDDNNQLSDLHTDLVINGAANASLLGYDKTAKGAVKCLGARYRVMRKEFADLARTPFSQRTYLTVVMGGSDPLNLTVPLIDQLDASAFDGALRVITGAAYNHHTDLRQCIVRSRLSIEHIHNCQDMATVFRQTRLAISAAGSSQFELLACGTPAILLVVADNQLNATQQAAQLDWCEYRDVRERCDFPALASRALGLWNNPEKLSHMSQDAYQHRDTRGSRRICDAIMQLLKEH